MTSLPLIDCTGLYKPDAILSLSFQVARKKGRSELKRGGWSYGSLNESPATGRGDFALQRQERIVTMAAIEEEISMNCPYCQATLSDNARFCTGCGSALAHPDPSGNYPAEAATQVVNVAQTASATAGDSLIGCTLEEKYKITARLGEGGMGAVYRATRVRIGDEVAVKVMHPQFVKDEATLERFRREARAAAMLHHPNVVAIHDYGEGRTPEAPAFIVMELVAGISLRDLLEQQQRLAPERAVALMREICNGVGAAHRHNVIHRDIKPDNIIVLPPGAHGEHETAKVLDFGIAKLRDLTSDMTLTQAGMVMGTPYYMSPEQCRAEGLDARSDVYSLGAMLYEMLAGTPPFLAATPTGVVAKHLMEPPPPFASQLGVPASVEAVIGRALAKDRNMRQADATVFARELQTAMTTNLTQPLSPSTANLGAGQATQVFYPPAATVQQSGAYGTMPPVAGRATVQERLPAERSRAGMLVAAIVSLVILIGLGVIAYVVFMNRKPLPSPAPSLSQGQNTVQPITPTPVPTNANRPETTSAPPADARSRVESKILNNELLDRSDLAGIADSDLRLLRNAAYARHGRIFDAPELQRYFSTRSWYRPRTEYKDADLTANDRANVTLIKLAEGAGSPPVDAAALQKAVLDTLNGWVEAMGRHDLDAYMSHYANALDTYYKRSNVSRDDVRADKARAFSRFATLDIQLSNVNIKPDETGGRVVVTYNKAYDFAEADGHHFSGSARSGLWLEKSGNRWLITSEKDL
jgi:ketosteroid isomerase-like protein